MLLYHWPNPGETGVSLPSGAHAHIQEGRGRQRGDLNPRRVQQGSHLCRGQHRDKVRLARLHGGHLRGRLRQVQELDGVQVGVGRLEVVWVAHQRGVVARHKVLQHEGTGARRIAGELGVAAGVPLLRQKRLGVEVGIEPIFDDTHVVIGQEVGQVGGGRLDMDHQCIGTRHLHTAHIGQQRGAA